MRPPRAIGCVRATSIASSRSAQSSRSKPTISSFVSANGPSETSSSPLRTRTVVAVAFGASAMPSRRRPAASLSATHTSMSGSFAESVAGPVSVHTNIRYFIATLLVLGFTLMTIGVADSGQRRENMCVEPLGDTEAGRQWRKDERSDAGRGGGSRGDAPPDRAQWRTAEELADSRRLYHRDEHRGRAETRGQYGRAAATEQDGLAELGTDEGGERDGTRPGRPTRAPGEQPRTGRTRPGGRRPQRHLAGQRAAQRGLRPFAQQVVRAHLGPA